MRGLRKHRFDPLVVALALSVVVAFCACAFSCASEAWTHYVNSQVITRIDAAALQNDATAELLEQAHRYNDALATGEHSDDIYPYIQQLSTGKDQAMGWIEIPTIHVTLPLYHTCDDDTLANGAGHVEGTSLPVGGVSSHCVIAAHSGLATARMFDDLSKLEVGDRIVLHVLGEELVYEVDDKRVVWPWETDDLAIEPGCDLVTLITCTPYGVNDHRLMVRAHRCPDEEEPSIAPEQAAPCAPPLAGLLALGAAAAGLCWWAARGLQRRKHS